MRKDKPQSQSHTQLGSPSSIVKKSSDKYVTYFNWLPYEIVELIYLYALFVSHFPFVGHVCWTYNNLLNSYELFTAYINEVQQNMSKLI